MSVSSCCGSRWVGLPGPLWSCDLPQTDGVGLAGNIRDGKVRVRACANRWPSDGALCRQYWRAATKCAAANSPSHLDFCYRPEAPGNLKDQSKTCWRSHALRQHRRIHNSRSRSHTPSALRRFCATIVQVEELNQRVEGRMFEYVSKGRAMVTGTEGMRSTFSHAVGERGPASASSCLTRRGLRSPCPPSILLSSSASQSFHTHSRPQPLVDHKDDGGHGAWRGRETGW